MYLVASTQDSTHQMPGHASLTYSPTSWHFPTHYFGKSGSVLSRSRSDFQFQDFSPLIFCPDTASLTRHLWATIIMAAPNCLAQSLGTGESDLQWDCTCCCRGQMGACVTGLPSGAWSLVRKRTCACPINKTSRAECISPHACVCWGQ